MYPDTVGPALVVWRINGQAGIEGFELLDIRSLEFHTAAQLVNDEP